MTTTQTAHCQCCHSCGSGCVLAPFLKLFDLITYSDIDSVNWWESIRATRDEVLTLMRKGPADPMVAPEDMKFWRDYQTTLERLSARLDRDYVRFVESRMYSAWRGTA